MVSIWRGRDREVARLITISGELQCLAGALLAGKNYNLFRGPAPDRLAASAESEGQPNEFLSKPLKGFLSMPCGTAQSRPYAIGERRIACSLDKAEVLFAIEEVT